MMSSLVDGGVFPGNQGGHLSMLSLPRLLLLEALTDDFMHYIVRVRNNAQAMAKALVARDYNIISDGTDNHMMLVDLRNKDISGKDAEHALVKAGKLQPTKTWYLSMTNHLL